jgi:hypothetical protein
LKTKLLLAVGITFSLSAFSQTRFQETMAVEPMSPTPTFRVTVVSRNVQAVNYKHRGGATKLDFAGTDLMPGANGQAKVESKKGYIEIEVEFGNLQKPTTFGNEYLTYVLWAVSPEGRAVNLGEVLVGGNHRSKLDVTTDLQAFALIVTAERCAFPNQRGPRDTQAKTYQHAVQLMNNADEYALQNHTPQKAHFFRSIGRLRRLVPEPSISRLASGITI